MKRLVHNLLQPIVNLPIGLCMLLCGQAFALNISIEFRHLTVDNGLPSNTINSVIRDSNGFIWVVSENGVSRYDGYTFTNFRSGVKDSASISSNIAYVVFEDNKRRLWIGSEKGLDLFNRNLDCFDKHYLQNIPIRSMFQDRNNNIWIGSDWGLYLYNEGDESFSRPFPLLFRDGRVTYNTITSMTEDRDGNLWIGTSNEGIFVYDNVKKTFRQFIHNANITGSLSNNSVRKIIRDHFGRMWIGTYGGGVNLYEATTATFKRFTHRTHDLNSIASDLITTLWEDGSGKVWIGTDGNGIDILNAEANKFQHVIHEADDPKTLSNDVVRSITSDGRGGVWIGTYAGGINFFNQNVEPFFHYSLPTFNGNSSVTSFAEDRKGNLWVGTDGGGLCYFDNATDQFINYYYDENDTNSLSDNRVLSLLFDHTGTLWIGTYLGGLCRFDPATRRFVRYNVKDASKLSDNIIWTLLEDHQHRIWVGTNNALNLFNRKKNTFTVISTGNSNLTNDMIRALYEDSNGNLWIGTQNGLNIMQSTFSFKTLKNDLNNSNSLCNNWIRTIQEDRKGNIWIGTFEGGLNSYNVQTGKFNLVTEANGLPNNIISSVFSDANNNLWIATGKGLARLDARTQTIHKYSINEGLQDNQFNINACFRTGKGEFLFGGINGFTRFFPEEIGKNGSNKFPPPVVFTDFKIFNRKVIPNEKGSPLTRHINETKELALSYDQYVITFEFAALNFVHPENNQYAYRLLGFETEWNYVGNKQSATYTNLDPGHYTLQVKASNNAGVWNQRGASIDLQIRPPFWKTWWFDLAVGLLILFAGLFIYIIVQRRIREKLRINRVIAELEIKALISQMNPHFVFNCLTSIQELVMTNRQDQAMHYLTQFSRLLRIILQNSDRNFTVLSDELMLLEAYLELESLRFDQQFRYRINVDDAIDPDEIIIPSFLIQPFVENGLWHGLMHKKDDRQMTVSFTLEDDEVLVCCIDDNGIGREASSQMKKSIKAHQSMGIKITSERIKLMKEQDDTVDLQIIDKKDEAGRATGTVVIVKLPANNRE